MHRSANARLQIRNFGTVRSLRLENSTTTTATLPNTASRTTTQTDPRSQCDPITSSHGFSASGIGSMPFCNVSVRGDRPFVSSLAVNRNQCRKSAERRCRSVRSGPLPSFPSASSTSGVSALDGTSSLKCGVE
uniref:Uncharacterized protein n=1 Tax=Anopheles melas TaxID=34690 RepID=A0A182TGJ2_9DIPT